MAGKVNGRKSKARVSDAIKLNGENDLETSTEEAAGDASITNIEPPIEEATPDSGTSTKSPKSTAKSPSPIKSAVRASRGSKRKEEAISASEEDSDAAQTTAASEMAAPRRGSRPKKPKLDPDMVNEKWTLKTVIKEEPQEEEPPAAAKTDSTESRPQSQQSFKSEDEGSISVGSPASGKSRGKTDMSNPAYRKPMMHGWKRELVFRATVDPNGRRQGDIYYYAPNGKKLRSGRELVDYLTDDLTLDNFTFAKEPIGINDPEKEIIRDAKGIKPRLSVDSPSGGMLTPPQASNTPLGKRVRKPKLPKGASPTPTPPHVTSETTTPVRTKTPPTTTKISPKKSFKVKLTNSRLSSPTVDIAGASGVKSLPKSQNRKSLNTVGDKPSNSDLKSEKTPATKINKRSNNKNSAEDESLPPSPKKKSVGKDKDVAADETSAVIAPAAVSSGPNVVQSVADGFTIAPNPFTQFFFTNISTGYYTLLQVFQYLKVQELLRASRVCRMWNELALDKSLWRTVRMKNSNIVNWTGFAKTLQKLGTKHLDLRKMLIASSEADEMWNKFSENIHMADSLTTIDICRCPARVLEQLFITNPGLTVINAVAIRDDRINIENITNLKNLQELRLKSTTGFVIEKDLSGLKELSGLKQLSITSVRDLGKIGCEVIGELTELRMLELGECTDFPESFGKDALSKLINLERLRLEKGQGNCCTFDILNTISQLPAITQLELLNFDIKAGFDKTLASCSNIRKLLIIPTYISQSATTNHMVLGGVINLSSSLTHFVWGVTLELLRVTELFVDQCEGSKKEKKPTSESIPVLKPVPGLKLEDASPGVYPSSNAEVPQVEIMPLPALQKLLTDTLPQTKIRILKIPFHSTWRQSISEFQ